MQIMSKRKTEPPTPAPPRYPSRENYTSVTISKKLAKELAAIAKEEERSLAYIVKKACEAFRNARRKEE